MDTTNPIKSSLSLKIQKDLKETLKVNKETLPAESPRDEEGMKLRVIRLWKNLFFRIELVDTASTITYILWRQDEIRYRALREKEERERLAAQALKAQASTSQQEKSKNGVKPSICVNTRGRALSPSKAAKRCRRTAGD